MRLSATRSGRLSRGKKAGVTKVKENGKDKEMDAWKPRSDAK